MSRPLGIEYPGAICHVISRGSKQTRYSGDRTGGTKRVIGFNVARLGHGYPLKGIADYMSIFYTTGSKVIMEAAVTKKAYCKS